MAANSTLLCIHRDPSRLALLQEKGYQLVTATNGSEGLRLSMTHPVDAIVLEYHLGQLDGTLVATEIKRVKPQMPIVMLVDDLELPDGALKSVDAVVTKSDGVHFLWATVHFVLNVKPTPRLRAGLRQAPIHRHRSGSSGGRLDRSQASRLHPSTDQSDKPFSSRLWRRILDGRIEF
ncbi:MAG TPA: response regulator [Candidatus Dormibacteraeota bacterium]|nr:response regulator [Candidatus Dormibacteraeota bacterium]